MIEEWIGLKNKELFMFLKIEIGRLNDLRVELVCTAAEKSPAADVSLD